MSRYIGDFISKSSMHTIQIPDEESISLPPPKKNFTLTITSWTVNRIRASIPISFQIWCSFWNPHSTSHLSNIDVCLKQGTKLGTSTLHQANYIWAGEFVNETTTPPCFPRRLAKPWVPVAWNSDPWCARKPSKGVTMLVSRVINSLVVVALELK